MIAVCDVDLTGRAKALRKNLFAAGVPCVLSTVRELKEFRPFDLIVTYYDAFDSLRHGPYDDVHALVIGKGFVNSALNARRVDSERECVQAALDYLLEYRGIEDEQIFDGGIVSEDGIFFANKHFEVFGNAVIPTLSEYMIFKYLYAYRDSNRYFTPEQIRRYCYPRSLKGGGSLEGNIAVHVTNLNRKLTQAYGVPLIRSRRYRGYYFDKDAL